MHALQQLGERLVALPQAELDAINIEDERLREAVDQARRIKARGGLRRQLQFIGKLMRSIDSSAIEAALKARDQQHGNSVQRLHQIESARDKLLSDGDNALGEILSAWPSAEPALLRQWHRQYPKEVKKGNERAHRRKLFRYLAGLDEGDSVAD
jgi:ribosome-associated protein